MNRLLKYALSIPKIKKHFFIFLLVSTIVYSLQALFPFLVDILLEALRQDNVLSIVLVVFTLFSLRFGAALIENLAAATLRIKCNEYIQTFNHNLIDMVTYERLLKLNCFLGEDLYQSVIDNLSVPQQVINTLFRIITQAIYFIILVSIVVHVHVLAGLCLFLTSLISVYLTIRHKSKNKKLETRSVSSQSNYFNRVFEAIDQREGIRSFGITGLINRYLKRSLKSYVFVEKGIIRKDLTLSIINVLSANLNLVSTIALSVFLKSNGQMTLSEILSCIILSSMISPVLIIISSQLVEIDRLSARIKKLNLSTYLSSYVSSNKNELPSKDAIRAIHIQNLSFCFKGSNHQILKDIDIVLSNKSPIAFVGKSGNGKSTLARLVAGIYDINCGEILFNNKEKLSPKTVIVPQKPFLLSTTIRKNLTLNSVEVSDDKLMQLLQDAGLKERVLAFDKGLNAIAHETDLSAGELQRLNIVRAILQNPDILIYDEPTSSLDYLSERKISDLINDSSQNALVIIIAHRLHTLSKCKQVVFFSSQQQVFCASHKTLKANHDEYADIFKFSSF